MKLMIFFLLFLSIDCFAKQKAEKLNPLLVCLGNEEILIHKNKVKGPVYRLNQMLINALAGSNNVFIKQTSLNYVCNNKEFSPSVALLREILLNREKIFSYPVNEGRSFRIMKSSVDQLLEDIDIIFFQYMAMIQELNDYPFCLNEEIPQLVYFAEQFKYLQEDIDYSLEKDRPKIKAVFQKIKSLNSINKKCQVKYKRMMELKKKNKL